MTGEDVFVIYADRRLQREPFLDEVRAAFGLSNMRSVARSDPHYRT